jgi:flagellar biosynthesis component FlhA
VTDKNDHEISFGVISITTKELLDMPQDSLDFLLAASFIMNDIRFYWSMMLRSPNDADESDLQSIK